MLAKLPRILHDTLTVVIRDTIMVPYPDTVWAVSRVSGPDLSTIGVFATAGVAAVAAIASFRAVRETRLATQATLLSELLAEYALPKMKNVLRLLGAHKATYGNEFVAKQRQHVDRGWPSGDRVDEARRYLSHYFFRVYRLRSGGYIDEKFFKQVAELDGVAILINICEPLAADLHPEYDRAFFDAYRIQWADRKDEHRIRPLPPSAPVGSRITAGKRLIRRLGRIQGLVRGLQQQMEGKLYRLSHMGVMDRIDEIDRLVRLNHFEEALELLQDSTLEHQLRQVLDMDRTLSSLRRGIGPAELQRPPGEEPPFNMEIKMATESLLIVANNMRALIASLRDFVGALGTGV